MKKLAGKIRKAKDNILVGQKVLHDIKIWETQSGGDIIRSSFNRELYYKLLSLRK